MRVQRPADRDRSPAPAADTVFVLVVVGALLVSALSPDGPTDDRGGRTTRMPAERVAGPARDRGADSKMSQSAVAQEARRVGNAKKRSRPDTAPSGGGARRRGRDGGRGTVTAPTGRLVVVRGDTRRVGPGAALRFSVEVEKGLDVGPDAFAAVVERVLFDERSWVGGGDVALRRVDRGPVAFTVTLAHPSTVDERCLPLRTVGRYSCWDGRRVMLNVDRWLRGAPTYRGDLLAYRRYLVNHEVGHALGHGHVGCPAAGRRAPVMVQQTMGLGGCRRNPWPYP